MQLLKEVSNAEVVRRLQEHDVEMFEQLYTKCYRLVYFQVLKILNSEEDAHDVTQEVFLAIYRSINTLNAPESLRSWIGGIAVRQALKRRRDHRFGQELATADDMLLDIADQNHASISPEEALCEADSSVILSQLIDRLPESQKITVLLYYYDECTVTQIANIMECSDGTVKSRLNYARKNLEKLILKKEKDDSIRLHSFSPALLFLAFLRQEERIIVTEEKIRASFMEISSSLTLNAGTAGTIAESAAAAGSGAGKAAGAISTKLVAAVLAGTLALGGGGYVLHQSGQSQQVSPPPPEPAVSQSIPEEVDTDLPRREALLAALESAEDVMYAKLIDMNGDGTEDLLLFGRHQLEGISESFWGFTTYLWNGTEIQEIDLTQGWHLDDYEFGIYREKMTGAVYVHYHSEMDGDSDSFESLTDLVNVKHWHEGPENPGPYYDMTRPNPDWSYPELTKEEYQAQLNRFELIESMEFPSYTNSYGTASTLGFDWLYYWSYGGEEPELPPFVSTIDEVRQQLEEP